MERAISLVGVFAFVGIAWALSENRRAISWRLVASGVGLQVVFAVLVLRTGFAATFFEGVRNGFDLIRRASLEGSRFVFGTLTDVIVLENAADEGPVVVNAVVAFQVLPIIVFVSTLAAMLYHIGAIQASVRAMAWLMRRTLKTSGVETFATALLVFLGIESMPTIKAYLQNMTRSELACVMTAFMATVAANVVVIYATFGADPGHLLAASIISAPAAIVIAKLLVPETESTLDKADSVQVSVESHNTMDAAARGASEGVTLAINVGALLIAFISLVWMLNAGLNALVGLGFTEIAGYAFVPFALLMGVPMQDCVAVGQLLGTKTVLNEFVAYTQMQEMIAAGNLQPRSVVLATYALCGFANPGSLGILLACLVGLAPGRRDDITGLGLKCLIGGTLAVFMTAAVAGVVI